ncbi:hypothetical protein CNX65_22470 [Actinosynnema pretiosum]|uniref:Uncharacterized protein n=1 Tax=Actinosynnema pretiosum TaxID=42197 RepID=A0A290Z9J9_9PSEU|nr:hypothetical protein CNX65_22470 [Actinosynnema pretiosum]
MCSHLVAGSRESALIRHGDASAGLRQGCGSDQFGTGRPAVPAASRRPQRTVGATPLGRRGGRPRGARLPRRSTTERPAWRPAASGASPRRGQRGGEWNGSLGAGATTTFGYLGTGSATTPALSCTSP